MSQQAVLTFLGMFAFLLVMFLFLKLGRPKTRDLHSEQKQNWQNSGYSHPSEFGDGGDGGGGD